MSSESNRIAPFAGWISSNVIVAGGLLKNMPLKKSIKLMWTWGKILIVMLTLYTCVEKQNDKSVGEKWWDFRCAHCCFAAWWLLFLYRTSVAVGKRCCSIAAVCVFFVVTPVENWFVWLFIVFYWYLLCFLTASTNILFQLCFFVSVH